MSKTTELESVKSSHVTFWLARRFVRDFHLIVRIDCVGVSHHGHGRMICRVITPEFISNELPRFTPLAFE